MSNYGHPYEPYDIQIQFMDALYNTIEQSKVGIFESPTGTGKTLSLICGSMAWLRDHQRELLNNPGKDSLSNASEEPSWVKKEHERQIREERIHFYQRIQEQLARIRERESSEKRAASRLTESDGILHKKKKMQLESEIEEKDFHGSEEAQFLVAEWNDEDEKDSEWKTSYSSKNDLLLDSESRLLLQALESRTDETDNCESGIPNDTIFFASRTHSQLSQFVQQLRLVKMSSAIDLDSGVDKTTYEPVRHTPLSSRKQLCINPDVNRLKDLQSINEKCVDLQKGPKSDRCPFLPAINSHDRKERLMSTVRMRDFRDRVLADIQDIEDVAALAKAQKICPYYGVREALPMSEIVSLPYPLLLQRASRKVLDISLKDKVVIIDEAHNLLDTLSNLYSMSITMPEVLRAKLNLSVYISKFHKRLSGGNKVYCLQIMRLLQSLNSYFTTSVGPIKDGQQEVMASDILGKSGSNIINVHKIIRYLQKSKLAQKIEDYADHARNRATAIKNEKEGTKDDSKVETKLDEDIARKSGLPTLTKIMNFLVCLANPSSEGKVYFVNTQQSTETSEKQAPMLKYLLLDPAACFQDLAMECRSVILAGGTMEPIEDYKRYLFPYLKPEQINVFSCGHVIPKENLRGWIVPRGPTGKEFRFTFEKRGDQSMLIELGNALMRVCKVIPGGIVVFFPSYQQLYHAVEVWRKTRIQGKVASLWDSMSKIKRFFIEPREAGSVDSVLSGYSAAAGTGIKSSGAVLLSIVGGKMSEGINFSDDLARCVIMVGMPFPNAASPEIMARRQYVKHKALQEGKSQSLANNASQEYYDNLCMRAVNQSIGRAIRHKGDFAVVLLFDCRWLLTASSSLSHRRPLIEKLPGWIRSALKIDHNFTFDKLTVSLETFFKHKA